MNPSKRPSTRRVVAAASVLALVAAGSALRTAVRTMAVGRLPL